MGNFAVIDFEEYFEEHGINLNAFTREDKERLHLAFESCKTMDEFVKEVQQILKNAADTPLKKDIQ